METAESDEFQCGQCQEKFTTLILFLLHKIQHVAMGKPGGCPLCGMAFSRQVSLREHLHRKHNLPQIKSAASAGKRDNPKKLIAVTESNGETISGKESKHLLTSDDNRNSALSGDAGSKVVTLQLKHEAKAMDGGGEDVTVLSSKQTEVPSCGAQQTMHVVIDKVRDDDMSVEDLPGAMHQGNCSVVLSSANAVMVENPHMRELGPLIEHVQAVSESHNSHFQHRPHQTQNPSQLDESQTSVFYDHPCDLPNHSHTIQSNSDSVQDSSASSKELQVPPIHSSPHILQGQQNMLKAEGGAMNGLSSSEDVTYARGTSARAVNVVSRCTLSPNAERVKSSQETASEEDPDFDFLFVLVTNHVKRNSLNYSKQMFKCFHCHYKTSWRRALVKHMRENHADNLAVHQCITVNKSEKLQDQQVMKMSEYTAVLARQRRQVNSHRIRGVERQDLPGFHPCNKCDKIFGRLRYLRKHQVIHRAEKKFLCDDCGKAFKTKAYLAAHRQTHQAKVYKCSQCDFTSSINALIHTHRQLHNDNSVICEVCGSAYNDRATLKKHKQVHDKARPYPCTFPGCTWRFKSEVMCRAHFRGHTTSGRFVCHLCSYVFRHKHHLQRHLGKVHGMDEVSVYRSTNSKSQTHAKGVALEACEEKDFVQVIQEDQPLADTVNLIVNSGLNSEQLQSVLESGQFVIATNENNSSVNYEVANITMNVSYDTLAESAGNVMEGQAILIPNDAECSQIIFQQETETVPASIET